MASSKGKSSRWDGRVFVVDASGWIKLWEEHYPREVFPTLWTELSRLFGEGRLRVPREVIREVGESEGVGAWLRASKVAISPSRQIATLAAQLTSEYPALTEGRMSHASSDPWIIATAEIQGWVAVSEEASGLPNKFKIPDVCARRNVDHLRVLPMLRALGVRVCRKCG